MVIDKLITLLSALIISLILTGGMYINQQNFNIEISQVDTFGIILLLFILIRVIFYKSKKSLLLEKWNQFFVFATQEKNSHRLSFLFISFILTLLFLSHVFKQWSFQTAAFDQASVHQPLFYPVSEVFLKCDICRGPSYLSEHISFSLLLLAPITSIFKFDEWIFFIQISILALSFFILFHLSPLKKFKKYWFFIALILLSHRSLRDSFITFFREDHIAYLAIISALCSLFNKKIFLYFLFIFIAILSKENVPFIIPFILIPFFMDRNMKGFSKNSKILIILTTLILPTLYIAFSFKFLLPYYSVSSEGSGPLVSRLGVFGNTPSEIIWTVFSRPFFFLQTVLGELIAKEKIKYLLLIFIPYLFLFQKAWYWIIPTLPSLFLNATSSLNTQVSQQFHYDLVILPFLIFGIISTLTQVNDLQIKKRLGFFVLLAFCISGRWPAHHIQKYLPTTKSINESFSLRSLPRNNNRIAANERILAQLSYQKNIILFSFFNVDNLDCNQLMEELKVSSSKLKYVPSRFIADSQAALSNEKNFYSLAKKCEESWKKEDYVINFYTFPPQTNRFLYLEIKND